MLPKHVLTLGDVVRATGLSASRIRQLDGVLEPVVLVASKQRRYDPAVVQGFMDRRARAV